MDCSDENIIAKILKLDSRSEAEALKCLNKCWPPASEVLRRMGCWDATERLSIFYDAVIAFIINTRQGKFVLTGEAKICTYVIKTAKNLLLAMLLLRKTKSSGKPEPASEFEPEPEDNEHLQEGLRRLDNDDRDILTAFYFYDIPLDVYAERKGISHDAAKKRISRARDRLKDLLKPPKK
jgi:hypothetical protein